MLVFIYPCTVSLDMRWFCSVCICRWLPNFAPMWNLHENLSTWSFLPLCSAHLGDFAPSYVFLSIDVVPNCYGRNMLVNDWTRHYKQQNTIPSKPRSSPTCLPPHPKRSSPSVLHCGFGWFGVAPAKFSVGRRRTALLLRQMVPQEKYMYRSSELPPKNSNV